MYDPIVSAFLLGLLGSLHCVGMCGPLAVGVCARRSQAGLYFVSRAMGYAFLGAVLGQLGGGVAKVLSAHWLQWGAVLGVSGFALWKGFRLLRPLGQDRLVQIAPTRRSGSLGEAGPGLFEAFAHSFKALFGVRSSGGLGLGLVTGVLPCGLLMGGWGLAVTAQGPVEGALVMLALNLATAPALLLTVFAGRWVKRFRPSFRVQGLLWCGLALFTLGRPLLVGFHGGH